MRDNNVNDNKEGLHEDGMGLDPKAPPLDPTHRLKDAMREALNSCSRKRARIVADMNELARRDGIATAGRGGRVSEALLDQWVAAGSTGRLIPLRYLVVFCCATGSIEPLRALAGLIGCDVIGDCQRKLLAWAQLEVRRRRLAREITRAEEEVGL